MRNDRLNTLWVLDVLKEYSDPDHILPMREIIRIIQEEHGEALDRRTVTACIKALCDVGYEISSYADNHKGYYLSRREFEISETRLLMDAIFSFHGISGQQTTGIIAKIQHLMSKPQRKYFQYLVAVKPMQKTSNLNVFLNIELLDEAIGQGKKASFLYKSYEFEKQLKPQNKRSFIVDPYLLLAKNGNYYLVCKTRDYSNVSFLRIDRMTNVKILEEFAGIAPKDVNLEDYAKKSSAVYFGKEELFRFRCRKTILNDVADRFGPEIEIYNVTDGHFDFSIRLVDKAATFFALEYLSRCEILSPEHARERMRKYIRSGMERYMNEQQ